MLSTFSVHDQLADFEPVAKQYIVVGTGDGRMASGKQQETQKGTGIPISLSSVCRGT